MGECLKETSINKIYYFLTLPLKALKKKKMYSEKENLASWSGHNL